MYEDYKIKGPYLRASGRKHITLTPLNGGKRRKISYPKYLMELHLGRYLVEPETVDHINQDKTDDRIENLRVINRSDHSREDARRLKEQSFNCPTCQEKFNQVGSKLHDTRSSRRKGKAGPFCSRSCAGKYGAAVQNNKILPLEVKLLEVEYTNNKELAKLLQVCWNRSTEQT